MEFFVPVNDKEKIKENEKRDKYLNFENSPSPKKQLWSIRITVITIPKILDKGTEKVENRKTGGNHLNYRIVEIGHNTKKSPGDLRRLAVTQTPLKDYQLTLTRMMVVVVVVILLVVVIIIVVVVVILIIVIIVVIIIIIISAENFVSK